MKILSLLMSVMVLALTTACFDINSLDRTGFNPPVDTQSLDQKNMSTQPATMQDMSQLNLVDAISDLALNGDFFSNVDLNGSLGMEMGALAAQKNHLADMMNLPANATHQEVHDEFIKVSAQGELSEGVLRGVEEYVDMVDAILNDNNI